MSVEQMKNMRVIGPKYLLNRVLHEIILQGSMHMIDALPRVNATDFFLPLTEKNIEAIEEKSYLKPYSTQRDFAEDERIARSLYELFDIKPDLKVEFLTEEYDFDNFMRQFLDIQKIVSSTMNEVEDRLQEIERKKEYLNNLKYLAKLNLDIGYLDHMKYLVFKLIKITKENYDKLKKNYENIPAVILKLATEGKYVILLSATLETLEDTLERIFSSLNYATLPLPTGLKGTAQEVSNQLIKDIEQIQKLIEALKESIGGYKEKYSSELRKIFSRLEMEKKIEIAKSEIAMGNKLFFMCGFVPSSKAKKLIEKLEKIFSDKLTILVDDVKKIYSGTTPPTKLNNIKLFKPFESLVKMYGIPSYQEKDPTVFFAITYMIIFGAMFGDVGQGLILLLSGLFLEYYYHKADFGGVLNRLGLSSIIFGFLYGSVFGSEDILPALVARPMANINSLLISAVIFGVIIISISYIFSIINAKNEKNIEEGLLGENGLAGFILYLLLLYSIYQVFIRQNRLYPIITILLVTLPLIILFKEPLTHILIHSENITKKLSPNEFIEEGFGIIEMLLAMLSNTISFLRVGAFALNHVGLYIAFLTLANMMRTSWGNWAVLVVGNIVILTLEALIVFIQALRLEYYELFNKYYRGDGIAYAPIMIVQTNNIPTNKEKKRLLLKTIILPAIEKKSCIL